MLLPIKVTKLPRRDGDSVERTLPSVIEVEMLLVNSGVALTCAVVADGLETWMVLPGLAVELDLWEAVCSEMAERVDDE